MRYKPLPIGARLARIAAAEGEEAMIQAREAAFIVAATQEGFQLVTALLRDLERAALQNLREGRGNTDRQLGRLHCIEEIRRGLVSLLPEDRRRSVDWADEEEEEFLLVDPKAQGDDDAPLIVDRAKENAE